MHNQVEKTAATLREMVRHEDAQRDSRMTWLCQLEGLLFASLGFAWGKSKRLTNVLIALGMIVAVFVFLGLVTGTLAHKNISNQWRKLRPRDYNGPDIFGLYSEKFWFLAFLAPENIIPIVFFVAWILVWRAS